MWGKIRIFNGFGTSFCNILRCESLLHFQSSSTRKLVLRSQSFAPIFCVPWRLLDADALPRRLTLIASSDCSDQRFIRCYRGSISRDLQTEHQFAKLLFPKLSKNWNSHRDTCVTSPWTPSGMHHSKSHFPCRWVKLYPKNVFIFMTHFELVPSLVASITQSIWIYAIENLHIISYYCK